MSFVSHVECTICGARHDAKRPLTVCEQCGQMLAVRYDLERVKAGVTKDALRRRAPGMYRFRELTPVDDSEERVTLGEGGTPLLELPRLAAHLGVRRLWAKDEGQNPTGSFKARGLGMAITRARTFGARGFVIPSAGNAGGAAAVDGLARGSAPAALRRASGGLRAGREGLRRGRRDDDRLGEPHHARRRAPGALAVRGTPDAAPPARYARRCGRGQREGDPGSTAPGGPDRGYLDRARVGGARRRPRPAQGPRRGRPGRRDHADLHRRRAQIRSAPPRGAHRSGGCRRGNPRPGPAYGRGLTASGLRW